MGKPSVVIEPIDFDLAARAVDKFSQDRKYPSMMYQGQGEGAPNPLPVNAANVDVFPSPPRRERPIVQRIPVELPSYVFDDIKRRALDGHCSARHIIMKALRAYGVHIADDDMPEDGRRLR